MFKQYGRISLSVYVQKGKIFMSKNYKGGYKLIDLQKNDFEDGGVDIIGIHHAIESSYAKALLLTGIVIDGVEKNDVYVKR